MKVSVQISLDGSPPKQAQLNSYGELKAWLASLGPEALSITNVTWQILDLEKQPVKSINLSRLSYAQQLPQSVSSSKAKDRSGTNTQTSFFDHRITTFLIRLFPKGRYKAEMEGDLCEVRTQMIEEGTNPQWLIYLQMLGKVMFYAINGISIHISNFRNNGFSQKP